MFLSEVHENIESNTKLNDIINILCCIYDQKVVYALYICALKIAYAVSVIKYTYFQK